MNHLPPLEREMALAFQALPFAAIGMLEALGVPLATIGELCGAGMLGRARVEITGDGLWHPDEGGEPRLLLAVHDGAWLVDIVALSSAEPDSWALRTGHGAILGALALDRAVACDGAVRLHGNPVAWMAAGCEGICVLDWGRAALNRLRGAGAGVTLVCDDAIGAARLRQALAVGGLPMVASAMDMDRGREAA
ncbi:hypothetical protein [Croceicoccus sp. BE223]|uniref:hypothetical protein n=1 Tax=Croceicoccus sp. BE223 TaxID=2817716 RepID=UPI002860F3A0|nr:hypothetical protein [Croceicoccus sp. BE223]MDR7102976.1 hypothetical protein [Croceicoccus sp. BE223]